nr:14404_t:CDS:2 [Entrophospora candida]
MSRSQESLKSNEKIIDDNFDNKNKYLDKQKKIMKQELNKLKDTEELISLSLSRVKDHPKDNPEYFERRKIIALENYKKKQAKKQRVRLKHLITIYHNISNFINLENLDEKIEDIFGSGNNNNSNEYDNVSSANLRTPFTTTLEDMQMDYIESGGGINANEARRRIESIKDALYGTSHGGKYPGLKMIENWAKENNHSLWALQKFLTKFGYNAVFI